MPKIVRFHQFGGPEVLQIEEEPTRQPRAGEVRLRVQAVGLNRGETLFMRGHYFMQPHLPSRIGYEASSIIIEYGLLCGQPMAVSPFADAANASEYLKSNEQVGKVVIQVS
jgi:NADPH:quinone reductase-like Zn-dependent oxidoreductase